MMSGSYQPRREPLVKLTPHDRDVTPTLVFGNADSASRGLLTCHQMMQEQYAANGGRPVIVDIGLSFEDCVDRIAAAAREGQR